MMTWPPAHDTSPTYDIESLRRSLAKLEAGLGDRTSMSPMESEENYLPSTQSDAQKSGETTDFWNLGKYRSDSDWSVSTMSSSSYYLKEPIFYYEHDDGYDDDKSRSRSRPRVSASHSSQISEETMSIFRKQLNRKRGRAQKTIARANELSKRRRFSESKDMKPFSSSAAILKNIPGEVSKNTCSEFDRTYYSDLQDELKTSQGVIVILREELELNESILQLRNSEIFDLKAMHRESIEKFRRNLIDIEDAVQEREKEIEMHLQEREEEISLLKKEISLKNDRIQHLENDVSEISEGLRKEICGIRRIWEEDMKNRNSCKKLQVDAEVSQSSALSQCDAPDQASHITPVDDVDSSAQPKFSRGQCVHYESASGQIQEAQIMSIQSFGGVQKLQVAQNKRAKRFWIHPQEVVKVADEPKKLIKVTEQQTSWLRNIFQGRG